MLMSDATAPSREETSVKNTVASLGLSPSVTAMILATELARLSTATKKASALGSTHRPWIETHRGPSPSNHRVPAQWRDVSDYLRIQYAHQAIVALGPVQSFTLNLSSEIEALAKSKPSAVRWLHARINKSLGAVFGRQIDFVLVLEEASDHRLHCHGEFGLANHEAVKGRAALRKAGGDYPGPPQYQTKTMPAPDALWASYELKDFYKLGPKMRDMFKGSRRGVDFEGRGFSMTSPVHTKAAALYQLDRSMLMATSRH
jgi:hypothetical protein